ncbi:ATP-grasp domain-containing protein [Isoptericola sp. NEAU-Y5]|uniref:biotin carboxylase n=1 Tax=Isoptericola luteus TaxID=2879484 RepID=A0ABS7ZB85_9MICO|nr:biotin carboxylase N-terminal domain-containing protein [Isoptericola sp. NEAU-Y5]MCA5892308.1 ATP-grasp domain-containing protein [Isoptericola sp. NEAU-Y5]
MSRSPRPFTTVLVANRGEIACRVIGTLRRLGIRSVAVHSDADAGARHVREADVAVRLPSRPAVSGRSALSNGEKGAERPLTARTGYLDVRAVVDAAVATGAQAIHPGYGFLAENPALAQACERAGIVFVGPGVRAMTTMADKVTAKRLVAGHGVPVLPGTLDGGLSDAELLAAAADVGFPLLVKPVAGGGGKGMVVAGSADRLAEALASARRVAASSFGDDGLLLERLVDRPRHVEVQVLADTHGTVVHLGERECSLQRRHQKVVEEAPSPAVDAETRARMGEAACAVARSVGYVGAGTVELLVPADDPTSFSFIEMNTRLQVEHPVTELVTGVDLVEAQLRVAAGEPLWFAQDDVRLTGHAVEARVYAETPARGFLPATGQVLVYDDAGAAAGPGASPRRLDSGIAAGSVVTGDYDPMLAKAVAHGTDRAEALARLDGLLGDVVVLGVETNVGFLRDLLADDAVRAGRLDTGLIDRFLTTRPEPSGPGAPGPARGPDSSVPVVAAALLALAAADGGPAGAPRGAVAASEVPGPWAQDGWRLNAPPAPRRVVLADGTGAPHVLSVVGTPEAAVVTPEGAEPVSASLRPDAAGTAHRWSVTVDAVTRTVVGAVSGRLALPAGEKGARRPLTGPGEVWVHVDGRSSSFTVLDRSAAAARQREERAAATPTARGAATTQVRADMPGTVAAVPVSDGDHVLAGATLVVVEAMKMEHALVAPHDGVVGTRVRPGEQVRLDQVAAVVERAADPDDAATDITTDTPPENVPAHPPADSAGPAAEAHPAPVTAQTEADPATTGAT